MVLDTHCSDPIWHLWQYGRHINARNTNNTRNARTTRNTSVRHRKGSRCDERSGYKKIGEYAIIEANSNLVAMEALTDRYLNYVSKNDFNWCMILYSDKNDHPGVYSISGIVQKEVGFTKDKNGDYSLSEADATSHAIIYAPTNSNTPKEFKMDE